MGDTDAIDRIRGLAVWQGAATIEPCPGGRTNLNFRVVAGEYSFFARLGRDLPHHGIARSHEARCCKLAAAAGIGPTVVVAEDGILVTEFVAGRTLVQGEAIADQILIDLADTLRRLHAAPAPRDLAPFDPAVVCRRDLDALPAGVVSAPQRRLIENILARAPRLSGRSLIHADLIPENVIVASNRLVLVDWEYSGLGDPAVDVASVIVHFGLDRRQAQLVVERHGGVSADTIGTLRPVLAAREALWCEVQLQAEGPRGDLPAYTRMCWRRLQRFGP
ncbi:MAG: hypothetical protein FJX52_15945 [Alphaproteobacteria bacterium]|nr:hypothetical protein [Alphaproteobacteria bacterium]